MYWCFAAVSFILIRYGTLLSPLRGELGSVQVCLAMCLSSLAES